MARKPPGPALAKSAVDGFSHPDAAAYRRTAESKQALLEHYLESVALCGQKWLTERERTDGAAAGRLSQRKRELWDAIDYAFHAWQDRGVTYEDVEKTLRREAALTKIHAKGRPTNN